MTKVKTLITALLLLVVSLSYAQINIGSYRILDQYLQDGKLKVNQNATETTFEYEVTLTAFMNNSTGYANPATIQLTIGINGSNLANSLVYSSQARTIQSTEFPRYTGAITKTYSATIQNSHLSTGKKVDVWQYVSQVGTFQPLDRYEYDYVLYTPAPQTPTFTISGNSTLCGTQTYSISSLPAGATIAWSVTTGAAIVGNSTGSSVQVTESGFGSSPVLSAAVTVGTNVYQAAPMTLTRTSVGRPSLISFKFTPDNRPGGPWKGKLFVTVSEISGLKYNWYVDGAPRHMNSGSTASFQFLPSQVHLIEVETVSPCGAVSSRLGIEFPSGTVVGGGIDDPLPPILP